MLDPCPNTYPETRLDSELTLSYDPTFDLSAAQGPKEHFEMISLQIRTLAKSGLFNPQERIRLIEFWIQAL